MIIWVCRGFTWNDVDTWMMDSKKGSVAGRKQRKERYNYPKTGRIKKTMTASSWKPWWAHSTVCATNWKTSEVVQSEWQSQQIPQTHIFFLTIIAYRSQRQCGFPKIPKIRLQLLLFLLCLWVELVKKASPLLQLIIQYSICVITFPSNLRLLMFSSGSGVRGSPGFRLSLMFVWHIKSTTSELTSNSADSRVCSSQM